MYIQDMVHRIRPDFLLLPAVSRDQFPLYVSDMFCGDYPAAMFTKVWAKMLAADAFSAVQEARSNGETSLFEDERVKKVTMRYRNTVLGQGSALPASDIFRQFRLIARAAQEELLKAEAKHVGLGEPDQEKLKFITERL